MAYGWNGTRWTQQVLPKATAGDLAGVSCTTATACTAVGNYYTGTETGAVIVQSWNGSTWTNVAAPDPGGTAAGDTLYAVSCTAPSACTAVGKQNGPGLPLVERPG